MRSSPSSLSTWATGLRSPKLRRAVALCSVVLATGGLVLYKAPSSSALQGVHVSAPDGANTAHFRGPGAHGSLSLSHGKVLARHATPVFAEIRFVADASADKPVRAPLALAVVLDTSGSMSDGKIEDAKRSVLRLLSDMRDEDEIALVRYSDDSQLIQPLARVGDVREMLESRIRSLVAGGGTNIPSGLSRGLRALDEASRGRVRRIVLVSDGLDGTRAQAEELARSSFSRGITVSSLGIGLDFDQAYMGSVAQSGHGNFGFVNDGGSLASFLKRELEETATTTVEDARVTVALPTGLRFVSATGCDARVDGGSVELRLGSLFAGDERRVIVELAEDRMESGARADLRATASYRPVGSSTVTVSAPALAIAATDDAAEVEGARDPSVFASAMSVIASKRQLEATDAYARGERDRAMALAAENESVLRAAAAAAPAAAPALDAQLRAYSDQRKVFAGVSSSSVEGKAAAKSGTVKELENLSRAARY